MRAAVRHLAIAALLAAFGTSTGCGAPSIPRGDDPERAPLPATSATEHKTEFPLPPDLTEVRRSSLPNSPYRLIQGKSPQPVESVAQWFRTELAKSGWVESASSPPRTDALVTLLFEREGKTTNITLIREDLATSVNISTIE